MKHPSMRVRKDDEWEHKLRRLLLVVPVNTIANWEYELEAWQGTSPSDKIEVLNMNDTDARTGDKFVGRWKRIGGALLISDKLLSRKARISSNGSFSEMMVHADIVVLDEAHTMLKNDKSETSRALQRIKTKRRILLTGSPFQNNLLEYYRMCEFIRPGVFGVKDEAEFVRLFEDPIMAGQAKDASAYTKAQSVDKSEKLHTIVEPFIHRVGVSVLAKDLPPLTQVVVHVGRSKCQNRLYQKYKRSEKLNSKLSNFFKMYTSLRPINNHPGTVFCRQSSSSISPDEDFGFTPEESNDFLKNLSEKNIEDMQNLESGFKIVLLMHILVMAKLKNERVLIFSMCLKTLDFVERALQEKDWISCVPSIGSIFDRQKIGGWQKGEDYLRLDGDLSGNDRGDIVKQFNDPLNNVVALLISSKAGGLGINLVCLLQRLIVSFEISIATTNALTHLPDCRQPGCPTRQPLQPIYCRPSCFSRISIWARETSILLPFFNRGNNGREGLRSMRQQDRPCSSRY